ncbi:MAG: SRPBCC family protein [Bacteroidetes bacterium]|nr:SRPBCC family protein [Bacteroidota bacterium]
MKIVKGILIALVVLAAIVSIVGFLSPKHVHVERSLTISAPAEIIHEQINNLKNWEKWSPWQKMDPAMKTEYSGSEAGAGASSKWTSENKNVGSGDMTITSSTPDSITTAINFMENGTATGKFIFAKSDSGIKVTWSMESDMGMNPIGRIFGLFMDKMMGPDFEKGLAGIKEVAEAIPTGPKKYRGFEVMEMDSPEMVYIGKKDSLGWAQISEFYQKNLPAIFEAVGKAKLEPAASPSGLYFSWDTVNKIAVMAAAIPVKGDSKTKVKGFETFILPAGKMLHIAYMGGYNGIGTAHMAMDDYMHEKGFMQLTPIAEEYVTDPGKEPDSTKWLTNVYYPVK